MGVRVTVPASSANLGPGFDSFAVALSLRFELTVTKADKFSVVTDMSLPKTRKNLCVKAFETLLSAENYQFTLRSQIPLIGGLGSSAAGILAGLAAANYFANRSDVDIRQKATELDGHPDNVTAALHGGFVVCGPGKVTAHLNPPPGLTPLLVVPRSGGVPTYTARRVLPADVPLADAAANCAHAALLALGLQVGDFELIAAGLTDHLHQPYRAPLYPQSHKTVQNARSWGALGATVSGAGPTVLVWCSDDKAPEVTDQLRLAVEEWADVKPVRFETSGLTVDPLEI